MTLSVYNNERDVELPWIISRPILYPALDVGSHESIYLNDLTGPVDGIDLRPQGPSVLRQFYQADIRTWQPPDKYPTVIALSTVEHVGLAFDAYGTEADDEVHGDRHAIEGCLNALLPDGVMYLTVPFGEHGNFGWYRRYDQYDLDWLLRGTTWHAEYHHNASWQVGGVALVTIRM